jgi:hypothetical protein
MGSLQYEYEWNHGHKKESSLQCGPKLSSTGQATHQTSIPSRNVWNWMKNKLQDSKATSLPQLQQEIKFLWTLQMDDIQYLKKLVESMPRRLEAVILNEGNSTKY